MVLLVGSAGENRLEYLKPAELLYISGNPEQIVIETDLGETGKGGSICEAVADMRETATGKVLLDTVEQLIADRKVLSTLQEAPLLFRPAVMVWIGEGKIDPERAAEFLRGRKGGKTLLEIRTASETAETLQERKGKYWIETG